VTNTTIGDTIMMSMFFRDFKEALEAWREHGGVLKYYSSPEGWEVILDEGTIRDYTTGTFAAECITPRLMTEYALEMGGLTPEEIAQEMAHWQD